MSLSHNLTRTVVLATAFLCRVIWHEQPRSHALTRVHKVSTEYFAAEQSPGNIERHVLQREDSDDDFLEADGRQEVRSFRLPWYCAYPFLPFLAFFAIFLGHISVWQGRTRLVVSTLGSFAVLGWLLGCPRIFPLTSRSVMRASKHRVSPPPPPIRHDRRRACKRYPRLYSLSVP